MNIFEAHSDGFIVRVRPEFSLERSDPSEHLYIWIYHIEIENLRTQNCQLLKRWWRITSGHGKIEEVGGDGVVGLTPDIAPGDVFTYNSGVPLNTPTGFMEGKYFMRAADGEEFSIKVPVFSLDSPFDKHKLN